MIFVDYCGVRYDENTDWREFLDRVIKWNAAYLPAHVPQEHQGFLDTGYRDDPESRLHQLAEALKGTPMLLGLATAAVELLESGLEYDDEHAVRIARALPYRMVHDAFTRLLRVLESRRLSMPADRRAWVLTELLELRPSDERARGLLASELHEPAPRPWLFELAARHMPEWLANNVAALRPGVDTATDMWILVAPPEHRQRLLSAIAGLGQAHIEALIHQVMDPLMPTEPREKLLAELRAHPAFAGRV